MKRTGISEIALSGILSILTGWYGASLFLQYKNESVLAGDVIYVQPERIDRYSIPGEFSIDGIPVDAPQRPELADHALYVMKYHVLQKEYARCVAEGVCSATAGASPENIAPVTGVTYHDAQIYAQWLSNKTGRTWRLPTDLEWANFSDMDGQEEEPVLTGSWTDQWIKRYRMEASRPRAQERRVYPAGHFGINKSGLADIGGNVWEWTKDCFNRFNLDQKGNILSHTSFCGVRVLQGQHRSYMPDFVGDASSGGCGVGTPPDYIGFRLVRDPQWHDFIFSYFHQKNIEAAKT